MSRKSECLQVWRPAFPLMVPDGVLARKAGLWTAHIRRWESSAVCLAQGEKNGQSNTMLTLVEYSSINYRPPIRV